MITKTRVILICLSLGLALFAVSYFQNNLSIQAQDKDTCKTFYDKAKHLAEESTEPLPQGQTVDFDPRMAKSNSSIAYSQIYRNCKEYGE